MKRSGEKKRHDCISSRKFFPTPKNVKGVFAVSFRWPDLASLNFVFSVKIGPLRGLWSEAKNRHCKSRPFLLHEKRRLKKTSVNHIPSPSVNDEFMMNFCHKSADGFVMSFTDKVTNLD